MGHDNEITLRVMLDNIRDRKNDMGDNIPVSYHKVKSHVGVRGNERADTLAKRACKEPGEAKVVEGSQGSPRRAWVTFGEGAGVTGYKRVSEGVRKHRQGGMISTEKVSKWHVVSGGLKLDMATAGKAAWGSHVPQGVRQTVHKARGLGGWRPSRTSTDGSGLPTRAHFVDYRGAPVERRSVQHIWP